MSFACPSCGKPTTVNKTRGARRWRACTACDWKRVTVEQVEGGQPRQTASAPRRQMVQRVQDARPARCRIEDIREARELGLMLDMDDMERAGLA